MSTRLNFLFIISLFAAKCAFRLPHQHICGFLPANKLAFAVNADATSGITEGDYQNALNQVEGVYAALFYSDRRTLILQADWNDPRVNSYATRDDFNNPVIIAPGGLARYPMMSKDALVLIYCHEIGHFLGGAPKALRGQSGLRSWSSAEGEADYFASARCLKKIFQDERLNEEIVAEFPLGRRQELEAQCLASPAPAQCMRILQAGLIAADVFSSVTGHSTLPGLSTPDLAIANQIIYTHPSAQCRLDTFVSGAKCQLSADAKFDDIDPAVGVCDGIGARPQCWFVRSPGN